MQPEVSSAMKPPARDLRNQPAYGPAEAARYLKLPAATLRSWTVGRDYPKGDATATFHPLIAPASARPLQLSFYNLVEAHVLRALRTEHGVAIGELRKAIDYAQRKLHIGQRRAAVRATRHRLSVDRQRDLVLGHRTQPPSVARLTARLIAREASTVARCWR